MGALDSDRRHDNAAVGLGMPARFFYSVSVFLLTPAIALAAAPQTFAGLVTMLVSLMNSAIGTLVLAALVLYFFGILANLRKAQEGDSSQLRTFFMWGIIAVFVMVSVWGILRILQATLFSGSITNGERTPSTSLFCNTLGACE